MLAKGWNQSDLARHAGLKRDSISTYINGKSAPTPQSLKALSLALGVEPEDLLPNHLETAIANDPPSFSMQSSANDPSTFWVTLNRRLSLKAAVEISKIIAEEDAEQNKE